MNAFELRIARDYLVRRRWFFIIGFILHLVMMMVCWWEGKAMVGGVLLGGELVLMVELNRAGMTRTLLSLPVTGAQLGKIWRFVALVFPAVFFLLALLLSVLVAWLFGAPRLSGEQFVIILVSQTLILGTVFLILTGLPSRQGNASSFLQQIAGTIFGLIWGLTFPVVFFFWDKLPKRFEEIHSGQWMVTGLLVAATVAGWFRTPELVRGRITRPGERRKPVKVTVAETWKRLGGMPYYLLRFGGRILAMAAGMVVVSSLVTGSLMKSPVETSPVDRPYLWMFVMMGAWIALSQMVAQLRVLRILPLGRSTLTHWLIVWPLVMALLTSVVVNAVFVMIGGGSFDWRLMSTVTLGVIGMLPMLPALLRFGFRLWIILPVFMVGAMAMPFLNLSSSLSPRNLPWVGAGTCVLLVTTWRLTYWALASHYPWRGSLLRLPGVRQRIG